MATYNDIFELNIKYIEYLLSKSQFTHQYVNNIQKSGSGLEYELRNLFFNILPARFKVTHGYIASASSRNTTPTVSPQVDLIIVDTFVPHSLFVIDNDKGMEIVPVEAVVGVFEIKRTLNRKSLLGTKNTKGALEHLCDICDSVGLTKNNQADYLPGGLVCGEGISGGFKSNPLIGIISFDYSKSLIKDHESFHQVIQSSQKKPEFNIIASLGGFMYGLADPTPPHNWKPANVRGPETQFRYGLKSKNKETSHIYIIARTFGYIIAYLAETCGRKASIENYFFNDCLGETI